MKIVLLETATLGDGVSLSGFSAYGEVEAYPLSTIEETKLRVKDADFIVVNKIPMNEETLSMSTHLKAIFLTATGMNNIDFSYTNQRGIYVKNVSGYSTASVVQHTFALLFYLYEHLESYREYVLSGAYQDSPIFCHLSPAFHELSGKTFGIVGLGEIGRGVAAVAKAFGCRVIYYSTSGKNNNKEYERCDFPTLLSSSDIISVHAPLNDATYHLFNEEAFRQMKPGAFFLNLGRGPIVEESALAAALLHHQIAGAGLDVLSEEPLKNSSPLADTRLRDTLLITPHIGWGTLEARQRCIDMTLQNIAEMTEFFLRD